jgi:hypothetical protein
LSNRWPIAADASSDCSRLRLLSSVSTGGANTGELKVLDTSVGGVDGLEKWELDETLAEESGRAAGGRIARQKSQMNYVREIYKCIQSGPPSQLAQK